MPTNAARNSLNADTSYLVLEQAASGGQIFLKFCEFTRKPELNS